MVWKGIPGGEGPRGKGMRGRIVPERNDRAGSGVGRCVAVGRETAPGPEPGVATGCQGDAMDRLTVPACGRRHGRGIGFAIRKRFDGCHVRFRWRLPSRVDRLVATRTASRVLRCFRVHDVDVFAGGGDVGGLREREQHQPGQRPRQQQRRPGKGTTGGAADAGSRRMQGSRAGQPDNEFIILMIIVLFRKGISPNGKAWRSKKGRIPWNPPFERCHW